MWKQPVLVPILAWLLILPSTLQEWLSRTGSTLPRLLVELRVGVRLEELFISSAILLLSLVTLWGWSCVLLLGKRMIQSRAGRARTSFRCVRKDALPFVLPLLFTSLLQGCFILYRSLLYVIPTLVISLLLSHTPFSNFKTVNALILAIIALSPLLLPALLYEVRTFFFDVTLVTEGRFYRAALRRSMDLTQGRSLRVLWTLLLLAFCTLLPGTVVSFLLDASASHLPPLFPYLTDLLSTIVWSCTFLLFLLSVVAYYGALRDAREGTRN